MICPGVQTKLWKTGKNAGFLGSLNQTVGHEEGKGAVGVPHAHLDQPRAQTQGTYPQPCKHHSRHQHTPAFLPLFPKPFSIFPCNLPPKSALASRPSWRKVPEAHLLAQTHSDPGGGGVSALQSGAGARAGTGPVA